MKKRKAMRLVLGRETLRRMSEPGLAMIHGGSIGPTQYTYCIQCGGGGGDGSAGCPVRTGLSDCLICMAGP